MSTVLELAGNIDMKVATPLDGRGILDITTAPVKTNPVLYQGFAPIYHGGKQYAVTGGNGITANPWTFASFAMEKSDPEFKSIKLTTGATNGYLLSSDSDGNATWVIAPTGSTDTWRPVTAGGNSLASNETLAFVAGTNVTISENAGSVTINSTGGSGGFTPSYHVSCAEKAYDLCDPDINAMHKLNDATCVTQTIVMDEIMIDGSTMTTGSGISFSDFDNDAKYQMTYSVNGVTHDYSNDIWPTVTFHLEENYNNGGWAQISGSETLFAKRDGVQESTANTVSNSIIHAVLTKTGIRLRCTIGTEDPSYSGFDLYNATIEFLRIA